MGSEKSERLFNGRTTEFCVHTINNQRCGMPFNHGAKFHTMYPDTSSHFGAEAVIRPKVTPMEKIKPRICHSWSAVESLGQCQLPEGHAGAHNFAEITPVDSRSDIARSKLADTCNIHSRSSLDRCTLNYGHTGVHMYPMNAAKKDLVVYLESTKRPCILQPGCPGEMAATLRRYTQTTTAVLWWNCSTCSKSMSFAPGSVEASIPLAAALSEVEEDATIHKALKDLLDRSKAADEEVYTEDTPEVTVKATTKEPVSADMTMLAEGVRDMLDEANADEMGGEG